MVAPIRSLTATALAAELPGWDDVSAPAYRALAGAIGDLVLEAKIALGVRLPAERDLAAALGVSRATVTAAYDELRAGELAISRRGAGTWTAVPADDRSPRMHALTHRALPAATQVIDFTLAAPAAPAQAVLDALARASSELPRYLAGHGYDSMGLPRLRAAIAASYERRGAPTAPEQVLVTAGALHGIDLTVRALLSPGDRVAIESPTYPGALGAIRAARARTLPVDLDVDGWTPRVVEACLATVRRGDPALAYVIPDFQNPTGVLMPDDVRERLVSAARRAGVVVLADETFTGLGFSSDAPPVTPMARFDPTGSVISVGSLSKSVWGGLRIGWVRASAPVVARIAAARASSDLSSPLLEQLLAAELLDADDGRRFDAVLDARRHELRASSDALLTGLRTSLPQWRAAPPSGGLSLWVELDGASSSALAARAGEVGLRLAAGPRFGDDTRFERRLRLPFTHPPEVLAAACEALALLVELVAAGGGPARTTSPAPDLIA